MACSQRCQDNTLSSLAGSAYNPVVDFGTAALAEALSDAVGLVEASEPAVGFEVVAPAVTAPERQVQAWAAAAPVAV